MKQNTFYILIGIIGLALLVLFWLSIEFANPFLIAIGFVIGAVLYFYYSRQITDSRTDERQQMIDMKTASATLKAFWVSFFTVNLATVVYVFSGRLGFDSIMVTRITHPETRPGGIGGEGRMKIYENIQNVSPGDPFNSVAITIYNETGNVSGVDTVYAVTSEAVRLIPAPPEMIAISHLGIFGVIQILLLILMLFIYVGFRVYYSHKFGEWDDDEE